MSTIPAAGGTGSSPTLGGMGDSGIVALVDYDNMRQVKPERTQLEVEANLATLIGQIREKAREHVASVGEIEIRLYGGWVNERGQYTRNAQWLFASLRRHWGRRDGVILKPRLITRLAARPTDPLVGTFRAFASPPGQKMVDSMLTVDAIHFSARPSGGLMIFSDDDDFVPAAIVAGMSRSQGIHWIRVRATGQGLNDRMCTQARIAFGVLGGSR